MADGNEAYTNSTFNVQFLKTNSGKKGEGMPVVRNSQFYFREGLCWSDINTTYLKCRKKQKSINDVKSMSLFGLSHKVPEDYIISLINTTFFSEYVNDFINNTQTFQINDARQLPIIVPTGQQLSEVEILFSKAYNLKLSENYSNTKKDDVDTTLISLRMILDNLVLNIYDL